MADKTPISWADATWNVITGCTVYSPGCQRCYAMKLAGGRMSQHWSRKGLTVPSKNGPVWTGEVRFNDLWLDQPIHWRSPKAIFVCAHSDLFHEDVPDEWIDRVHGVIAACPRHLFMVLTKRIERARRYYAAAGLEGRIFPHWACHQTEKAPPFPNFPLANMWLGTSIEDQEHADERLPHLIATPAALHWVSVEPMLGAVDLRRWLPRPGLFSGRNKLGMQLVIAGGESQPGARWLPAHHVRDLRDHVVPSGAPFHFKQWGAWLPRDQVTTAEQREAIRKAPFEGAGNTRETADAYNVGPTISGHLLDGVEHRAMPPWPQVA